MTTLMTELDDRMERERPTFAVVHPLDDAPEEKVETEYLGPMPMTRAVRISLFTLRGYLLLMVGLLAFRVLQLAGVIHG
ncbi:MAG: hypothetical protein ABSC23_08255 [Bryobacteraceae bacterium]|jgi:hypothetical protein